MNEKGANGPDVIEKRLNQGSESTKYFGYFLEERANIEEMYLFLLFYYYFINFK